ncbi:hypothetical protein XMIN_3375 [Xanthomonas citri pv. mangiferaeindicae LMG 941]|nr:hypothetical protein XMIN_3375 [Xanthomonas citri pv. mangiferaeindicae LMG 941]
MLHRWLRYIVGCNDNDEITDRATPQPAWRIARQRRADDGSRCASALSLSDCAHRTFCDA